MMHRALYACVLGTLLVAAPLSPAAADISGTWVLSISLEDGPQNVPMTLVLKQSGEKLSGTGGASGEQKVAGTVKGNAVAFSVEGKNRSGEPYKNTYSGTIESANKMAGTCEFPKGPGKWTATRK